MEADPAPADQRAVRRLPPVGDAEATVVEIQVHGRWGPQLCMAADRALRGCLAEHPSAIIVDLHRLKDLDAASTALWLAAANTAGSLRPPVQLVLSLPPTRRLARHLRQLEAVRFLPIYATTRHALAAVAGRRPR